MIWSNMYIKYVEMVPMVEQPGYPHLLCRHQDPAAGGFQIGNLRANSRWISRWTNWVPKCSKSSGPGGLLPCTTSHLGVLAWWERTGWSPHVKPRSKSAIAQITRKPEPRGLEISPMCSSEPAQPFAKPVLERIQRYPNISHWDSITYKIPRSPRRTKEDIQPSPPELYVNPCQPCVPSFHHMDATQIQIHSNAVYIVTTYNACLLAMFAAQGERLQELGVFSVCKNLEWMPLGQYALLNFLMKSWAASVWNSRSGTEYLHGISGTEYLHGISLYFLLQLQLAPSLSVCVQQLIRSSGAAPAPPMSCYVMPCLYLEEAPLGSALQWQTMCRKSIEFHWT